MMLARRVAAVSWPSSLTVSSVILATVYLVAFGWAMGNVSYDVWGALVIAPVLFAITIPLLQRAARSEDDPRMLRLLMFALTAKLAGSLVRYFVAFAVYDSADAQQYHKWGVHLAPQFRHLDFNVDLGRKVIGTGFIEIFTGVVYAFTGDTKLGGFLVFSWLGFWGLYFFYRAFRIAVPQGDYRRYALLVFFLPSLLFWPSSIGKESWMMLTLGLTAYGAARLLTSQRGGFVLLALGMLGTLMVRPHITLVVLVAVVAAFLLRRSEKPSLVAPVVKAWGLVVLLLVGTIVLSQANSFLGVSRLDTQSADKVLTSTTEKSALVGHGAPGSKFEAKRANSPVGFVRASLAVFFRPWPWEAHNAGAAFASLEGLVLLGLTLTSLRRLAAVPRTALRIPYVALAAIYSLLFVYAFSSIANFGILSRQRVQLFPIFVVLLCIPSLPARRRRLERMRPSAELPVPV